MTAVTFADPDNGLTYVSGYVNGKTRVSGVVQCFRKTAAKLRIPKAEVDFIDSYLTDWLHPLTHPAEKSMRLTINPIAGSAAIGNYFDWCRTNDYQATAANIANVAQRIRVLFESAVPTAYLYFG